MGTSPPSGHALLVTERLGRGGGGPAGAAAGACAHAKAHADTMGIPEKKTRCITFISFLLERILFRRQLERLAVDGKRRTFPTFPVSNVHKTASVTVEYARPLVNKANRAGMWDSANVEVF